MRTAGIREARQALSQLLDEVQRGREVVITDRGRPVARLVSVRLGRPFPDLRKVRLETKAINPPLSQAVVEEREDRV